VNSKLRETRAQRSARIREDLLRSAARVFRSRGFHGASLEQIAGEAGCTKGAVYSNFEGKDDLFLAVYDRQVSDRFEVLSRALDAGGAAGMVHAYRRLLREDPEWSLVFVEFVAHASRHPELRDAMRRRSSALIRRLGERIGAQMEIDGETARKIALAMLTVASGAIVRSVVSPEGVPESLALELIDRYLAGEGMSF